MGSELWQRIRTARKYANMSQQQLGDACGVSREAVSQWESADPSKRNTPGFPRLRVIAKATGTPYEWLASDESTVELADWQGTDGVEAHAPDPEVIDVPVFSRRTPGRLEEPRSVYDQAIGSLLFRRKSLERKGINAEHVEVHYAADDAMLPRIPKGAAVLLDGSQNAILDGRTYVIEWADQEQIRRLYRELDGTVRVVATNPASGFADRFARPEDFKVLGRVRWVGSWED